MKVILDQFQDLFEEINLKESTYSILARPYKHPHYQKTEIEKIVQDLQKSGVLRPSEKSNFISCVVCEKI